MLTTNHRRLAILYFAFIAVTGFTGLVLATIIRLELAYPGQFFLAQNAERYLTIISLHGIIMVFFVVIPVLFGAFGNFLLPTQLGIRDVAFPRLNSFMFWVTPAGFVMLLHIVLFDRAYSQTYWVNYSELRAQLRRRYHAVEAVSSEQRVAGGGQYLLGARLHAGLGSEPSGWLLQRTAPTLGARGAAVWGSTGVTPAHPGTVDVLARITCQVRTCLSDLCLGGSSVGAGAAALLHRLPFGLREAGADVLWGAPAGIQWLRPCAWRQRAFEGATTWELRSQLASIIGERRGATL